MGSARWEFRTTTNFGRPCARLTTRESTSSLPSLFLLSSMRWLSSLRLRLCLIERAVPGKHIERHVIFLDDNVELDYAHIVDVRDRTSGDHVPFEEANGVYLHRARPIDIILDRQYFIKEIAKMEAALLELEGRAS
eukprot:m.654672 g.654672  ORF g.654672 m.654672 type:complete len:136 (+) comp58414_c0_seq18:71-478(+)